MTIEEINIKYRVRVKSQGVFFTCTRGTWYLKQNGFFTQTLSYEVMFGSVEGISAVLKFI